MGLPALAVALTVGLGACNAGEARTASPAGDTTRPAVAALLTPVARPARAPLADDAARRYRELARSAWQYFENEYQSGTGLVNAVPRYHYTTLWDVGAQLLAFVAARDVGLVDSATFARRVGRTLETLQRVELFRNVAFNRFYSTADASIAEKEGVGVSATDLGRLLVALHVLARRHPEFAAMARAVVARNDLSGIVRDGYLYGHAVRDDGTDWTFQEGRVGYEQYIAAGFSHWGADVAPALSLASNARPLTVLGVPLAADKRGKDRLLSEPFILQGLELGLNAEMNDLAQRVLRAQEARYTKTGQVTIASEDAVAVKPYYFYYYCVYCNAKPFTIGVASPTKLLDAPRWVSTKAAFGWDALFPDEYTRRAVAYVEPAFDDERGWATGVYEGTRASTKTYDINTAAVLLEVAAYQLRGGVPLARTAPAAP